MFSAIAVLIIISGCSTYSDVKPILDQLRDELKVTTQSNVAYPASDAELELPKRTLFKRQKRGEQ